MSKRRYVVIGAGAVGGLAGARLAEAGHEVAFVARGEHGAAIERDGLKVRSPLRDVVLRVPVVADVDSVDWRPGDVVLLAVKSQHTEGIADRLASCVRSSTPIVSLQNGVSNEPALLRRFDSVIGALVQVATGHHRPGEVVAYAAPETGIIDVGPVPASPSGHVRDLADEVSAAFAGATFRSTSLDDVMPWKRRKLIANLLNAAEALCGRAIRGSELARRVQREGEDVLAAAGLEVIDEQVFAARRQPEIALSVPDGAPPISSSTSQSVARRTPDLETFHLNGEIIMLGRLAGVDVSTNELVQARLLDLVRSGEPLGSLSPDALIAELDGMSTR